MTKKYILVFLGVLLFASLISTLPKADAVPSVVFDSTISLEGAAGTSAIDPSIAVAGDLVWIVWVEDTSGTTKIMMKNSTDGGTTFGTVTDLSQNVSNTSAPPICPTISPSDTANNFDCRGHPQVYANGTNAYVVWQDEEGYSGGGIDTDFKSDVFYRKISYSGSSFTITPALASTPLRLNAQGGVDYAVTPVIAASATGPYVHVVWIGTGSDGGTADDHVFHSRSVDSGATFTATKTILTPGIGILSFVMRPDIAVDGSNVYAVWEDQMSTNPSADILFSASSDNGNIFNGGSAGTAGNPKNLVTNNISATNTNTNNSLHPQIAAAGGNAYVVWDDVSGARQEIFYRNSTDAGSTFGPVLSSAATLLSASGDSKTEVQPQIGTNTDGTKVFVTWAQATDADIKFKKSIDSGVTFAAVQDIDTAGTDLSPKLDSLGNNLYIVWQDTSLGGSGDIFFTSSSDAGTTFANKQNLSSDGTLSATPQLDSASSHVVWVDAPGGNSNILTQSGVFGLDLSWNATDYRLSETGTITLLTGSGLGTIDVTVKSSADGTGFTKTLTETSTGTYTGSITFSDTATSGSSILKVAVGGTITVTKGTTVVNANIFPRTVAWEFATYNKGDGKVGGTAVRFTVTNQHTNVNPLAEENISVTVSSLSTGNVITITAKETGVNTGLFKNDNLIFSTGISTATVGSTATITQIGVVAGANYASNAIIDTFDMGVKSSTFPTGILLVMTETTATSNIFKGTLFLNSTAPPAGPTSIQVSAGDILSLTYNSATENFLINTNPNPRVNALSSAVGDTVTATYLTASAAASVTNDGAGGGGGGGVSRAGLVVNALAGISSLGGGGGSDGSAPVVSLGNLANNKNFDIPDEIVKIVENYDPKVPLEPISTSRFADFDLPLTINENGYPLAGFANTIQTFSADVGKPITITSLYYEQTALQHVSMYLNLRDNTKGDLSKSDTQILYNKDKPISIVDPNGFFESVSMNVISDEDGLKKFAQFKIIFAKPMDKSDIVLRSWDDRLRSMDTIIYDAIQVGIEDDNITDKTMDPEPVETLIESDVDAPSVPEWIKSNAGWWSQGAIDDTTFKNALQFLIQEHMIDVPIEPHVSVSTDGLTVDEIRALEEAKERVIAIPEWIKSNAEWWAQGEISEDDFLTAIEYMVKNGIIEI